MWYIYVYKVNLRLWSESSNCSLPTSEIHFSKHSNNNNNNSNPFIILPKAFYITNINNTDLIKGHHCLPIPLNNTIYSNNELWKFNEELNIFKRWFLNLGDRLTLLLFLNKETRARAYAHKLDAGEAVHRTLVWAGSSQKPQLEVIKVFYSFVTRRL